MWGNTVPSCLVLLTVYSVNGYWIFQGKRSARLCDILFCYFISLFLLLFLYLSQVKDTTSPPPLNHNEPPPLSHNTMPGGIRMNGPNHPPNYDTRMGIPRMPGHPHMIENYPGGHPSPQIQNNNPMMMIGPESMQRIRYRHPTRCGQSGFPAEFDLTDILPSEKPSQTLSYYPPINPPENEPMQSPLASMGQSMQPHPSPQQVPGNR